VNAGITIFIVLLCMAILYPFVKGESSGKDAFGKSYRFSLIARWIIFFGAFAIPGVAISVAIQNIDSLTKQMITDVVGTGVMGLFILFAWLYYSVLSIKLTDKMIIRKSLFGYIRIPYEDVKKIVVHGGGSNPLAAMAKIHGQKTFSIFALLTDYDQLLNEIIARCSNAVVIEK
jgi:hypothetical protein